MYCIVQVEKLPEQVESRCRDLNTEMCPIKNSLQLAKTSLLIATHTHNIQDNTGRATEKTSDITTLKRLSYADNSNANATQTM